MHWTRLALILAGLGLLVGGHVLAGLTLIVLWWFIAARR